MLNDPQIRALKPSEKPRKVADAKLLYLHVMPSGEKIWRMKYFFPPRGPARKEKTLTFGPYPEISLREARDQRDEARRDLRMGIDPMIRRRAEVRTGSNTFEAVAKELLETLRKASTEGKEPPEAAGEVIQRTIQPRRKRKPKTRREPISAATIDTMQRRLEMHVFPFIGTSDVEKLKGPDVLPVLRRIESRGTYELAHRVRSICSRVLRYGKATGRSCEDVTDELIELLVPVQATHMAAITEPLRVGQLLRAIDGYVGEPLTRLGLQLNPYVFPRPIEFRTMRWENVTLEGASPQWRIPWRRMKMREPHIVPLSRQAVSLLRQIHAYSGDGPWVFPQLRHPDRPMSENCLTVALRAMGFSGDEMTWHGFRGLANTLLEEMGWNEKWIDMQLAHQERNKVRAAYNHARYLLQRTIMMQAWADYLDMLRVTTDPAIVDRAARESALAALQTFHEREKQLMSPALMPSVGREVARSEPTAL